MRDFVEYAATETIAFHARRFNANFLILILLIYY